MQVGLDLVGAAMHDRFIVENKPGSTMRKGTTYSTWFNGGLRTTTYFHNMIGLLTEIIGNPTPMEIPFRPEQRASQRRLALPDRPATVAFPAVHRLFRYRESRGAGSGLAHEATSSSTTSI